MRLPDRLANLGSRLHLPRRTLRLRLTLVYGSLFLVAGVGLVAITYLMMRHSQVNTAIVRRPNGRLLVGVTDGGGPAPVQGVPPGAFANLTSPQQLQQQLQALAVQQRAAQLHQLLVTSGIALAIMAVVSIGLGWLVAGRGLRPLRTITSAVRSISAANLRERLAMGGPADELKQLGDTFDGLLERLDASFEAQRQFVANASHELRTPLARQRTLVEVALRDSRPTIESLRASHERVLAAGEEQEQLIEALLTLARGERGLSRREPLDLATVAGQVLMARRPEAERHGLHVDAALDVAPTSGDPSLAERLVSNLVDNAVRHNVAGGRIEVVTGTRAERAVLSVANTGPMVPPDEVDRMFEPFQRMGAERTGYREGFGLGLSIVRAIAAAHGATVAARARPGGGLEVEVGFLAAGPTAIFTRERRVGVESLTRR